MHKITDIFRTFLGYLTRPKLYPELGRKIYKNIFDRKSVFKGKELAEKWCSKNAISQTESVKKLGFAENFSLEKEYPKVFSYAKKAEENCPIKMGGGRSIRAYLCTF